MEVVYEGFTLKQLQSKSEDELAEIGIKLDKNGKLRNSRGQFIKGQSGFNRKGLVKKQSEAKDSKNDLIPPELKKKYGNDSKKALEVMLETAKTRSEVLKISKELLQYQHAKLASVEQKTYNFSSGNIEVEWVGEDNKFISVADIVTVEHDEAEPIKKAEVTEKSEEKPNELIKPDKTPD